MADTIVYGIANCDTVKKTRQWLDAHSIDVEFHDYKKLGIDLPTLESWSQSLGWESLLNRRGTTWRKLDDADKQDIDEAKALQLMIEHTSMIKRPVISHNGKLHVGFDEQAYLTLFSV